VTTPTAATCASSTSPDTESSPRRTVASLPQPPRYPSAPTRTHCRSRRQHGDAAFSLSSGASFVVVFFLCSSYLLLRLPLVRSLYSCCLFLAFFSPSSAPTSLSARGGVLSARRTRPLRPGNRPRRSRPQSDCLRAVARPKSRHDWARRLRSPSPCRGRQSCELLIRFSLT